MGIPVLVTTDSSRRGVFFGYVDDHVSFEDVITSGVVALSTYRNVIYWASSVGGVFGLAERGPDSQCRMGASISTTVYLNGVTSIQSVTPVAEKAFLEASTYE